MGSPIVHKLFLDCRSQVQAVFRFHRASRLSLRNVTRDVRLCAIVTGGAGSASPKCCSGKFGACRERRWISVCVEALYKLFFCGHVFEQTDDIFSKIRKWTHRSILEQDKRVISLLRRRIGLHRPAMRVGERLDPPLIVISKCRGWVARDIINAGNRHG